jgi:predicted dehydrogenase
MTKKSFGVGIVGCGLIGRKRILNLPSSCNLVAVYDVHQNIAKETSLLLREPAEVSDSVYSLVTHPKVDIVIVATAHSALAEISSLAVSQNRHVLVEKPGAISAQALAPVAKEAWNSGSVVHVGFNHRFHPSMMMAREIVRSGKYGDLLWVRGRYGHGGRLGYEKEWRAQRTLSGGGELLDQGSHLIDLTRFLFGDCALAYSRLTTSFWDMDVEDNAFVVLETGTGGTAWLHASWTDWKNTFSYEITLRNAKIDINGLGGSYGVESLTLYEMQPEMGPPPRQTFSWDTSDISWRLELEDLVSTIRGSSPMGATVEDALATLSIIEKAYS